MTSSQRIVLNTTVSYAQSVFGVGLALFSSRWILIALGQVDFGIFSVVGSLIVFVVFLNSLMGGSASRYFAYSIGQGDTGDINRWFNTSLSMHLCLATCLVLVGWPIGEHLVAHWLNIPNDRVYTSICVFRISLLATFFGMVMVPFTAMFTAKQHIAELAAWGVIQSILVCIFAKFLTFATGDRMLIYAVGMAAIPTFVQVIQTGRAIFIFAECEVNWRHWFDKSRLKRIFSFAAWNLIGGLGAMLRNQGSAILLNIYFGPKVNAAYSIANQVSVQTNQLAASMMGALTPEITSSEGRGDRVRMLSLSLRASKLGTILVLLFTVPLMAEMEYVLKLWLQNPPDHTALFCRLILSTFLIDRLTMGYMVAVNAHGRISGYQATLGTILVLTLPLAWLFLKTGHAPTSVGVAFIITMIGCSLGRVLWVKRLFGVLIIQWVTGVIVPCFIVAAASSIGALAIRLLLLESFGRLVLITAACIISSLLSAWFFALDGEERKFAKHNYKCLTIKLHKMFVLRTGEPH